MAKWRCRCGEVLTSNGPIPNPDGLYVMAEARYEERAGAPDFELVRESVGGHRCPSCDRLWVWFDGWNAEPPLCQARLRR